MWHVYVLACADRSLYTGVTTDLTRRLRQHNAGRGSAYTRCRRPVRVLYTEAVGSRATAQRQEAAMKRLTRREKLAWVAARRQ